MKYNLHRKLEERAEFRLAFRKTNVVINNLLCSSQINYIDVKLGWDCSTITVKLKRRIDLEVQH